MGKGATLFRLGLLLPAVLYILAIVAFPLVETVNLSFTDAALKPVDQLGWNGQLPEDIQRPISAKIICAPLSGRSSRCSSR
jgi:ABC-type sugar transport system permease subunit